MSKVIVFTAAIALLSMACCAAAQQPLLPEGLDYGRSFVNTRASWNSPRFLVESRCLVSDKAAGKSIEYLQCGSCKAENTFAEKDLFQKINYDFLPVFSQEEGIIFRRYARVQGNYRDVRPIDKWWGGTEPRLRKTRMRVLKSPDEIFAAMQQGVPIIGQTEIRDENAGRIAVLEFPIKTINFERDRKDWQIDTGPVILPDLAAPPEEWSRKIRLAYIAFRAADWADFIVEQPTPLDGEGQAGPQTFHYSGHVHHATINQLLVNE